MRKLFGGLNLTWPKVIIFAIIAMLIYMSLKKLSFTPKIAKK